MAKKKPTLLVLGAGASIAARRYPIESSAQEAFPAMPSSRNFFFDLFKGKAKPGQPLRFLNMLGMMYEGTNWLVTQGWGIPKLQHGFDPAAWRGVNVEEVLSFVDIGSRMYTRGSQYRKGFEMARKSLIDFIVLMLLNRAEGQHCELLSELVWGLGPRDSIISFNYDTLADYTLQHTNVPQFRTYKRLLSGKLPRVRDFSDVGTLLKLHGSVNWSSCSNRRCRYFKHPRIRFHPEKNRLPRQFEILGPCECGATPSEHAIIPPMTEKSLDKHDFFHRLWQIARAQMPRFERIVFVGYSFPPNDAYSEWLFRQLRFIDRSPPEIIVVNPEAMRSRHPTRKRYESIFKDFTLHYYHSLAPFVSGPWRGRQV